MSKPRYNWWPFVLNMIRDYPYRKRDYDELHRQQITPSDGPSPGGGTGASRPVERVALRQLPPQEQREYDAVHSAIQRTKLLPHSDARLAVIRLTLMRNRYTLAGAAMRLNITEDKAKQYRREFILLVACMYGFLTAEEYNQISPKKSKIPLP